MLVRVREVCWLVVVAVGAIALGVSSAQEEVRFDRASPAAIDPLALPYIESETVGGMTIGIWHEGQSFARGYGKLSPEGEAVPDGKTVYEIGSITKVMTGILLADAVERGELRLDQPIAELLPAGVALKERKEAPITLLHLSTHTSGLPRLPRNMKPADPTNPYADYTAERLHEFLNGHRPWRAPGKRSEYSNLAVGLLGNILARKSGKSYEELAQERLLRPLGMNDTSITLNESQRERMATPHGAGGEQEANWDIPGLAGAGALRSTAEDMLKFIAAQLEPPEGELAEAIDLAWQSHQAPLDGNPFAMGLGWHIAHDGETRWHTGQTGGYHAALFVSRHHEVGVVVLTNTATGEVDRLAEELLRHLAGGEVAPREFEKSVNVAPEVLARYAGRYEIAPQFVISVTPREEKLYVQATGQPEFRVYPRSETEWFFKVVDATIVFTVDDEGKATKLELRQNGRVMPGKRLEEAAP